MLWKIKNVRNISKPPNRICWVYGEYKWCSWGINKQKKMRGRTCNKPTEWGQLGIAIILGWAFLVILGTCRNLYMCICFIHKDH